MFKINTMWYLTALQMLILTPLSSTVLGFTCKTDISLSLVKVYTLNFSTLSKGVPQGWVLDPFFFKIYVTNLGLHVINCLLHLFADDIILYTNRNTSKEAKNLQQFTFCTDKYYFIFFESKLPCKCHTDELMKIY